MRTARLCCALNSAIPTVLLSWANPASAGVDNPTPENFIRRPFPSAVALGGYVYIDGGELSQLENGTYDGDHPSWAVNTTLSLPLTTSWTNASVTLRSIPKSAPSQDQQVLWSDPSTSSFYTWGGATSWFGAAAENVIWKFAADVWGGGEWSQATASNVVAFTNSIRTVSSAFTTVNGVGYSLGGVATSGSDTSVTGTSLAVQGMVTFDLASLEWNNASSAGLGVNGTTMNAQLEYTPFGPSGFLVLLGGDVMPVGALTEYEELDWNSVWVMDLESKTWYNQAITGSKPTKRENLCSVGVQGPNGTYEIFVYGGASGQTSSTASDVYVLSLPGFVMFKSPNPGTPRQNHACLTIGRNSSASATNRQMLVVGGSNGWLGFPDSLEDPDPWKQGLGILDLTELTWSSSYDPDAAAYDSPDVVKTWYSQGGLDAVSWTNDDLKTLFVGGTNSSNTNANGTSSSSSGASNSGSSSGGNNSSDSSSSGTNHTGAIAGGVVGGVAALAAIALLCWFLLRRRRNKTNYAAASQQPPELAGGDPHQQQQFHSQGYYPSEPKPELWTGAPHATELSADQRPLEMEGNHGSMYELPDQQVGGLRHGNGGVDVPQQTYTGGAPHYPGSQEVYQQDHYNVPGEQGHGQNGGYGFYRS